jgi:hypothetical protein
MVVPGLGEHGASAVHAGPGTASLHRALGFDRTDASAELCEYVGWWSELRRNGEGQLDGGGHGAFATKEVQRALDIRSRVAGSPTWLLRLVEDEPSAQVVPGPPAIDAPATFTEIIVAELHAAAVRLLAPRRLSEYLGAELRGALLASGVTVEAREFDVRGMLVDRVAVVPRRFDGVRLDVPAQIAVPGYAPIAMELYHAGAGAGGVELTCAGTVVAERIGDLTALGLDRAPWIDPALAGTIEFAGFAVPPGSRRGVTPDAAPRRSSRRSRRSSRMSRSRSTTSSHNGTPPPSASCCPSCAAHCAGCANGCRISSCRQRSSGAAERTARVHGIPSRQVRYRRAPTRLRSSRL